MRRARERNHAGRGSRNGFEQTAEGVEVVAVDADAARGQGVNQVGVAVVADVEKVEVAGSYGAGGGGSPRSG